MWVDYIVGDRILQMRRKGRSKRHHDIVKVFERLCGSRTNAFRETGIGIISGITSKMFGSEAMIEVPNSGYQRGSFDI